jgi:ribosomal protein S18 acetylase RimI-like enzyme
MFIRFAQYSDAFAIAVSHVLSWRAAYSHILSNEFLASLSISDRTTRWEKIIEDAESTTTVAVENDQIIGFANYGHCRDQDASKGIGEIWAIYISPSSWNRGAGKALLQDSVANLASKGYREATLWVLADNHRGRRFYEANGFTPAPESMKTLEIGGVHVKELKYLRRITA